MPQDETLRRDIELLSRAYSTFNARDIEAAIALMHADVDWPNGMEGGRVHGHAAVREYWTRQFGLIDSHVEPTAFTRIEDGGIDVTVHQVVKDAAGAPRSDKMIHHIYTIKETWSPRWKSATSPDAGPDPLGRASNQ